MTNKVALCFNTILYVVTVLGLPFLGVRSNAFSISSVGLKSSYASCRGIDSRSIFSTTKTRNSLQRSFHVVHDNRRTQSPTFTTSLFMYNLPPGGGGGGKKDIADIAKGAVSLLLTIAFFVSPLGGIVLGIFNSFLVFLFVAPLLATVGFQLWQKINTIQGPCPNCGVEVSVMKSKNDNDGLGNASAPPQLCITCGAILQANDDNTGINNVSGRTTINDLNDQMGTQASLFDFFSGGSPTDPFSTTTTTPSEATPTTSSKKSDDTKGGIDKSSVIDVDVLDEDKPFQ